MLKKKKLALLFILVVAGLFLSIKPAQAIFGLGDVGLFDLATMQLDALDFVDNTILQILIFLSLIATESIVFIVSAANILQWAIAIPIKLGIASAAENVLVFSGWSFLMGLVNMSFVLIFAVAALSHILKIKIGKTEPKKILANLIIVALLINFSLVFVGFVVDLASIFQRALLDAFVGDQGNLVTLAIEPWRANSMNLCLLLLEIPMAHLISALIPYANVASLVTIATYVLGEGYFGIISQAIVMILFNLALGGILFFYAALFIARVAMIWILAIISPLAFIDYALGTKKRWDEWLNLLTSWAFLGISALFFLGLGLKLFGATVPSGQGFQIKEFTFSGLNFNYLFLLVYLVVGLDFIKKSVPKYAETLVSQGKMFLGSAGKITKNFQQKRGLNWLVKQREAQEEFEEKQKRGERIPLAESFGVGVGTHLVARPARWAMRNVWQTGPEELHKKYLEEIQGQAKGMDTARLLDSTNPYDFSEGIQQEIVLELARKGKIKEAIDRGKTTQANILQTHDYLVKNKREKDAAVILTQASEDVIEEAIRNRFPAGMGEVNKLRGDALLLKSSDAKDRAEKEYQGLFNEILKDLPNDQVKNINKDLLTSKNGIEWVLNSRGERLSEIVKSFGKEVVDVIQNNIGKKGKSELLNLAKINPDLINFLHSNAARGLGLGLPSGIEQEYKYKDRLGKERSSKGDIAEDNRAFQKFMIDARKEAKTEPRIVVSEREKGEKLPKITSEMTNDLRREISDANKYFSAIQQQRKTLDILVQGVGKITQQISSLEQKASKTQEETELLKRLNSKIIQKQKEQIRPVSDSLHTLEEKFKESQKEIKDRLNEEKRERQEKNALQRLEKKANKK